MFRWKDKSLHVLHASLLVLMTAAHTPIVCGQNSEKPGSAAIQGTVCDPQDHPVSNATVTLEAQSPERSLLSHSDAQGHYRFEAIPAGTYTLHAKAAGFKDAKGGPIEVGSKETKSVVLHLADVAANGPSKDAVASLEFSDEATFRVAGITDPTNLGGHGSNVVLRTKEALARDTVSLKKGENAGADSAPGNAPDTAQLHEQRASIAEREGRPLEAVNEFERAAELEPTEPHLFAWGAELLLHRAFEPASEVFSKGNALYPGSVRILLGLAVAAYSRGLNEQASHLFLEACDYDPRDPTPYLFLGRLQESEKVDPAGRTERLKRFASLHPENAWAHYYYAMSLMKQASPHPDSSAEIEGELRKVIELDPHLGSAYLQLGVLYSEQKKYPQAISEFQKAIGATPLPDEAHYRLAQVYRQTGEAEKARSETELFNKVSQEKTEAAERERHAIQQFVYTLKDRSKPSQAAEPNPH